MLFVSLCNEPLEEEGKEVWEGVELAVEADVLIAELDSIFDVWILVFLQQVVQGSCGSISCLDFYRNE